MPDKNKYTKQPISPFTGHLAAVTDPTHWATFEHAEAMLAAHAKPGIVDGLGFCFAPDGGVVGIDLDRVLDNQGNISDYRALNIAETMQSYTEVSPSGKGLHVFVDANLEGGYRRENVEIYGSGRFFTVTGKRFNGVSTVEPRQAFVNQLAIELQQGRSGDVSNIDWSVAPKISNDDLWLMARNAANGEKFFHLWNGVWHGYYPSQSEADYALIDILAFYTDAPVQVRDMFLYSVLGQRDKATRGPYVGRMIAKAFDRKIPNVAAGIVENTPAPAPANAVATETAIPSATQERLEKLDSEDAEEKAALASNPYTLPRGMVGRVAEWVWAQSRWPMEELCLIAALGAMAGVAGRQYQFGRTGLNLYLMFLAGTGAGKEALSHAVSKIFSAVAAPPADYVPDPNDKEDKNKVALGFPAALGHMGPTKLTGAGLLRFFAHNTTLSCVSVIPEFSQTMSQMADPRAHSGLREFQQVLLDFYMKSSAGTSYGGSMNSDKGADVKPIASPSFTLVCEGTPERFWRSMSDTMVTDGLMSRFIVFERDDYPMAKNEASDVNGDVPEDIKDFFTKLIKHVNSLAVDAGGKFTHVGIEPNAAEYSRKIEEMYRNRGIGAGNEIHKVLWFRAHQNIMRMAALVAVGSDPAAPTIVIQDILWAERIIKKQVYLLSGKFRRGEVGLNDEDERLQYATVREVLEKWQLSRPEQQKGEVNQKAREAGVIPLLFIESKITNIACFRRSRLGSMATLRNVTAQLERNGTLSQVTFDGRSGTFYRINL